jgi:hypothetical protein
LLGVQTEYGDFGAIWGFDVLASVVVGYGRRGTGHTSPRDTKLEGKFLMGLGAEETETHLIPSDFVVGGKPVEARG